MKHHYAVMSEDGSTIENIAVVNDEATPLDTAVGHFEPFAHTGEGASFHDPNHTHPNGNPIIWIHLGSFENGRRAEIGHTTNDGGKTFNTGE